MSDQPNYAIFRCKSLRSFDSIRAVEDHNRRIHKISSADHIDPARTWLNLDLLRENWGEIPFEQRVRALLKKYRIKPHKRGVLGVEMVFAMSRREPGFDRLAWADASLRFASGIYGSENILAADLHDDETTPHLHVVAVPVIEVKRRRPGPAPREGKPEPVSRKVLSYSAYVGRTSEERRARFTAWHDKYAGQVAQFGLVRGISNAGGDHIPAKILREDHEAIETLAKPALELLRTPETILTSLERPSAAEIADERGWEQFKARILKLLSGAFIVILQVVLQLLPHATRGIFAKRARAQVTNIAKDRDDWKRTAQQADANLVSTQKELAMVRQKLDDSNKRYVPLSPSEAVAILGGNIIQKKTYGRTEFQVATTAGETLTLANGHFVDARSRHISTLAYIQTEIGCGPDTARLLVERMVGPARADATYLHESRLRSANMAPNIPNLANVPGSVRLERLIHELKTHVGVELASLNALCQEGVLTVDALGRGVLLPKDPRARGCVFDVPNGRCTIVLAPDGNGVQLGDTSSECLMITDDVALALQVADAALSQPDALSARLVASASVTEDSLNILRSGHRDLIACDSVFAPGWDHSASATHVTPDRYRSVAQDLTRAAILRPSGPCRPGITLGDLA